MKTFRFWWDEENIEHIANHGVEPAEAEAAIENASLLRKVGRGKLIAYGKTDSGRLLIVIYAPKDKGRIRIVTARDMTPNEKHQFRF
ncbi:MAG: BrnT family toxin [Caldilineaceae bacterium]